MATLEPETPSDLTPARLQGRLYAASSGGLLVPADVLGERPGARGVAETVSEAAAHAVNVTALASALKHLWNLIAAFFRLL
jgi:hypothetical protein